MSLSALFVCVNRCCVSQWATDTVGQILIGGDAMYLTGLENQTIPDAETSSPTYLPDQVVRLSTMTADRRDPTKMDRLPNMATNQNESPSAK